METYLTFIFVFVLVATVIGIFVGFSLHVRKNGGSMFFIYSGATDEMLTSDKRKAVEMIVEKNAGKKMEEQSFSDPLTREE